jgi:hypothetical protein
MEQLRRWIDDAVTNYYNDLQETYISDRGLANLIALTGYYLRESLQVQDLMDTTSCKRFEEIYRSKIAGAHLFENYRFGCDDSDLYDTKRDVIYNFIYSLLDLDDHVPTPWSLHEIITTRNVGKVFLAYDFETFMLTRDREIPLKDVMSKTYPSAYIHGLTYYAAVYDPQIRFYAFNREFDVEIFPGDSVDNEYIQSMLAGELDYDDVTIAEVLPRYLFIINGNNLFFSTKAEADDFYAGFTYFASSGADYGGHFQVWRRDVDEYRLLQQL